jgi:hypothetical protein
MPTVKYRLVNPKLDPRRTKLEIPGWAGRSDPRADGSHEQPWHCIPFSEYARAGIELCYPHDDEFHVVMRNSEMIFEEILSEETDPAVSPPPFRRFGEDYFTYQLLLDLKVDEGFALHTEPHPRFFTDTTGTCPIAVPATIRHWWPMIFFVVFKAPAEGQTHIFRPGEPFMQISIVKADEKFDLVEMPEEEAAERELQSRRIYASRSTLTADSQWVSSTNTVFDGTYRRLAGAAKSSKNK